MMRNVGLLLLVVNCYSITPCRETRDDSKEKSNQKNGHTDIDCDNIYSPDTRLGKGGIGLSMARKQYKIQMSWKKTDLWISYPG